MHKFNYIRSMIVSFLTLLMLGIALLVTLMSSITHAQTNRNCAERDQVINRLAEGYGETRQSIGLGANNSVVEVFASEETGSWTITVTSAAGITCLVATGQAFETTKEVLEPTGLRL